MREAGEELFQVKNHRDSLNDMALNNIAEKVVTCGDSTLKIHSMKNIEETEKVISVSGEMGVSSVEWSSDGTMLAAVTHSGNVLVYLISVPNLISVYGNKIALLTSLTQAVVHEYTLEKVTALIKKFKLFFLLYLFCLVQHKTPSKLIHTIIEPSIIAVGPTHMAVALNNRALFWDLNEDSSSANNYFERDYLASVCSIRLNEVYTSTLFDGKLQLHMVRNLDTLAF